MSARIIHIHPRTLPVPCDTEPSPAPPIYVPKRLGFWQRMSVGQRVDLVLGTIILGILVGAIMMVPG